MAQHHIIFEEAELALMKEVVKFVKQAKYELQGDELLAAAQIVRWIESLSKRAQPVPEAPQAPAPTPQAPQTVRKSPKTRK